MGKVPVLVVNDQATVFESAVICEYLNEIARLYNCENEIDFLNQCDLIAGKWRRLEQEIKGDYFSGSFFGMVDAAYGPIFRYFDTMEPYLHIDVFERCNLVRQWRARLTLRPSIQIAVDANYPEMLLRFLKKRNSYISELIELESISA